MPDFKFRNPPLLYLIDENRFQLMEDYVTPEVTVPAGFKTDGASVPRLFQNVIPPYHRWLPAAIVHDFQTSNHQRFSYAEACEQWKINLKRLGVKGWYYFALYYSVKWFGPGTIFIK